MMKKRGICVLLSVVMFLASASWALAANAPSPYSIRVEADKADWSLGDTVTVRILGSGDTAAPAGAFQFTLRYDVEKLQLVELKPSPALGSCQRSGGGTKPTLAVSLDKGAKLTSAGTELAVAAFKVKAAGTTKIGFEPTRPLEITAETDYAGGVRESRSAKVNLHDIRVTLNPGKCGLVNGSEHSVCLYAGYNTPGLFTDAARTRPASVETAAKEGYRLADKQWKSDSSEVADFSALETMGFTASEKFTLQTVKQHKLVFQKSGDAHIRGPEADEAIWADSGTLWENVQKPALTADEGYLGVWCRADGTAMKDGDKILSDLVLSPRAQSKSYSVTGSPEVNFLSGVEDGKVHTGTEVTFKINLEAGHAVKTVSCTVNGREPQKLMPDEAGVYKIPGASVVGAVEVQVVSAPFVTVTFTGGSGVELIRAKAYAFAGEPQLYSSMGAAGLFGEFTVPAARASEGYRLAEPLWSDGSASCSSESLGVSVSFTKNTQLTAQAVRQYTVSFSSDGNGSLAGELTLTLDEGYVLTEKEIPVPSANEGFVFKEWQQDGETENPLGRAVDGDLAYAAVFAPKTYAVTCGTAKVTGIPGTAVHGEDFRFTPEAEGRLITGVQVIVDGKPVADIAEMDGTYIVPGSAVVGDVEIVLSTMTAHWTFITNDTYMVLAPNTKIALLETQRGREGFVLAGVGEMYWSPKYKGYVQIVSSGKSAESLTRELTLSGKDTVELRYDGNLNGSHDSSGRATITAADAQPINALLHQIKNLSYTIDSRMRLEMDVNGDRTVSTQDIMEILNRAVMAP